jgi:type IV pilus assembly protein PilC
MLNRSGVSIIDSLNTVGSSLGNIHYRNALFNAAIDVSKGAALAPSLNKAKILPFILIRMIAVGEDTGALEKMLDDMSSFYDAELNIMADNLTKLMEPIILIVFGGMVGFLAVAIYLPIYSITQ